MSDHAEDVAAYRGPEKRSTPRVLSREELERIADRSAERVIARTFELLGADITSAESRKELRDTMKFASDMRKSVETVKTEAWKAVWSALIKLALLAIGIGMVVIIGKEKVTGG